MEKRLAVGTPVRTVGEGKKFYKSHMGREDLVVLSNDHDNGYGVGPEGNNPRLSHDHRNGWVYYPDHYVEAKKTKAPKKPTASERIVQRIRENMAYREHAGYARLPMTDLEILIDRVEELEAKEAKRKAKKATKTPLKTGDKVEILIDLDFCGVKAGEKAFVDEVYTDSPIKPILVSRGIGKLRLRFERNELKKI